MQSHLRKYRFYRQWVALFLLAVLLPMLAVKTFHFHSDVPHSCRCDMAMGAAQLTDAHHSECKICDFTLPPFETALEVVLTPYLTMTAVERSVFAPEAVFVVFTRPRANSPPLV